MGDARRLSKEHPEDAMRKGIATPITLIVLLVVFVSLLAATSYMALGALKGTATERAVYQAFLISESALDALPVLLRKAGCGGNAPTDYTLPAQGGPAAQATYVYKAGTLQENGIPKLPKRAAPSRWKQLPNTAGRRLGWKRASRWDAASWGRYPLPSPPAPAWKSEATPK